MEDKEFKAVVSLLDDEDDEIVQSIEDKIMSLGSPVIPFLEEEWENNFNPIVQRRIEDLIHVLQYEELQQRLIKWKDSEEQELIEGIWLLATYQYPDYELTKLRQDLEQI